MSQGPLVRSRLVHFSTKYCVPVQTPSDILAPIDPFCLSAARNTSLFHCSLLFTRPAGAPNLTSNSRTAKSVRNLIDTRLLFTVFLAKTSFSRFWNTFPTSAGSETLGCWATSASGPTTAIDSLAGRFFDSDDICRISWPWSPLCIFLALERLFVCRRNRVGRNHTTTIRGLPVFPCHC